MSDRLPVSERRLGDLLDALVNEQRKDIKAYSSGHLNHDKLWKHPTKSTHVSWESANKPIPVMREPSKIPKPQRDMEGNNKMTGTMYNFSMGTTGSIALPPVDGRVQKAHRSPSPRASPSPSMFVPPPSPRLMKRAQEEVTDLRPGSGLSYKSDNVYIEELMLPEVMLPVPGMRTQPKSKVNEPGYVPREGKIGKYQKQRFIQSHLGEVTKRDQFQKFQEFESNVLRRPDAHEQGVLTGKKAVEHLEKKLHELLLALDEVYRLGGPNFHRLQIFSCVFDDLVEDTPIFGDILKAIKNEYDLYMGSLLDNQSSQSSQVLYQQVKSLATSGAAATREVAAERHRVKHLEMEAKKLLKKNESLREELEIEKDGLANDPPLKEKPKKSMKVYQEEKKPKDTAEQIEALHNAILEQIDVLRQVRDELKENYVPNSVCQQLEQCVKETEVEIQRVLSTNDYLERAVEQLEHELEKLLEKSRADENEKRKLLKKLKLISDSSTDASESESCHDSST
ncbi:uncharacterized protein C6orf118-like [Saccoglossus kowalevskii]